MCQLTMFALQDFMKRRGDGGVELSGGGNGQQVQVFTPGEVLPELRVVQSVGWELQVYYLSRWVGLSGWVGCMCTALVSF